MKKVPRRILIVAIVLAVFYFCTGFFVVQPIGMLPEGLTLWYFRVGIELPFITSPDGFLLKKQGGVSLLTRAIASGQMLEMVRARQILRLPYIKAFYLVSTGGVTLDR
jgi:hypothetical protein